MTFVISLYSARDFLLFLLLFGWVFLSFLTISFLPSYNVSLSIQLAIKYLSMIIFFMYFKNLKRYDRNCIDKIRIIVLVNAIVFLLNMFAGIMGFGYSTYTYANIGIKGFFYAGNELFLVLLPITTLFVQNRKNVRLVISFIAIVISVLIGTKTAILALLIVLVFNNFTYAKLLEKLTFIVFVPLTLFFGIIIFQYFLADLPVFTHITNNIETKTKMGSSLISVLLSGRLEFLEMNLKLYNDWTDVLHIIFGGNPFAHGKSVEIDFFDSLIVNGILTTFFVVFFYIYLFIRALKQHNYVLALMNMLVFLISFLAGHVWANLMGGIFFIIANLFFDSFYNYDFKIFSPKNRFLHIKRYTFKV